MLNNRRFESSTIWVIVAIILVTLVADMLLVNSVEKEKRAQARFNLEQISYCYKNTVTTGNEKEALKVCSSKSRTSFTGDVYALDYDTLEFIHETSNDVPEKKLYLTRESVGEYFRDWNSAETAIVLMKLGKNSRPGVDAWYNFDGSYEWLEWILLPDEVKEEGSKRIIVVQGIQKDEVMSHYNFLRVYAAIAIWLVILLMLTSHNVRLTRIRNEDAIKRAG